MVHQKGCIPHQKIRREQVSRYRRKSSQVYYGNPSFLKTFYDLGKF